MTETTNYKLKKPGYEDYVDIVALNENADVIDVELHKLSAGKTDAAKPSAAGNLAALTADGKLQDSGRKPGEKNGVATLDENGHIPGAQIPNSFLPLAGGTMSGPINMASQRITNLPKPSDGSEPLRKDDGGSAETLALFGLGPDSVPDDVLAYLGKYAQHWWAKRKIVYTAENGPRLANMEFAKFYPRDMSFSIPYSSDISIDSNGVVSLKSPSELALTYSTYSQANTLKGKYFNTFSYNSDPVHSKEVYYMDVSESDVNRESSGVYYIFGSAHLVSAKKSYSTTYELLSANSKDAYPESGEKDGYYYQYLGIPFENLPTTPKISTGSYVGTGKYGVNNPNSLTFEFEPKLVMISSIESNDYFSIFPCFSLPESYPSNVAYGWFGGFNGDFSTFQDNYAKLNGNTLSWYYGESASGVFRQLNYLNETYTYIAIG